MKSALFIVLLLTGCANTDFTRTEVLTQQNYIVRSAPAILTTLPPLPPALPDPKKATNAELAYWISATEFYVASLENQLKLLVQFYSQQPGPSQPTQGATR